jgi:hypothetical protein
VAILAFGAVKLRPVVAEMILKIGSPKLRVRTGDVGGGFGMKIFVHPEYPMIVWASRELKRTVKWIPERQEAFQSDVQGRDHVSIAEMARATSRPDKVVGFHFFYPASVMRLIEVIEGEETSEETMQAAVNFAQQIRRMPIRCGEVPGFVVNRILNSAASEIWRHKDESGRPAEEIDKEISEARVTPMGPFYLSDLLGLDTVLHVAEHLELVLRRFLTVAPLGRLVGLPEIRRDVLRTAGK